MGALADISTTTRTILDIGEQYADDDEAGEADA